MLVRLMRAFLAIAVVVAAIVSVAGHRPVEFTGVMKINLETGEVVLEPQHFADIGRLCELLTAA